MSITRLLSVTNSQKVSHQSVTKTHGPFNLTLLRRAEETFRRVEVNGRHPGQNYRLRTTNTLVTLTRVNITRWHR